MCFKFASHKTKMNFQYLEVHLGLKIEPNQKANTSITKRCSFFIITISYFITPAWYFAFVAQTPKEYSESFFFALCGFTVLSWYSALFIQNEQYAKVFDELNALIAKRKLKLTTLKTIF